MTRFVLACWALAAVTAVAQDAPEFFEVRQSYAMPAADWLSVHIDAYGADVKIGNGPPGMVEAVFHIPDTLHPPVFERYAWADSGDEGEFQFARPEDGPGAVKGELWEIRVPPETRFLGMIHAGFADVALWDIDDLGTYLTADSANIVLDMTGLESGKLMLSADAGNGDVLLYAPKTALMEGVAECVRGELTAPGFTRFDLDALAIPELDFKYRETQQGWRYSPTTPGGAEISFLFEAERGDVKLVLVDDQP